MEKVLVLFKKKWMLFYLRKLDMRTMGGIWTWNWNLLFALLLWASLKNYQCNLSELTTLNISMPCEYEDNISCVCLDCKLYLIKDHEKYFHTLCAESGLSCGFYILWHLKSCSEYYFGAYGISGSCYCHLVHLVIEIEQWSVECGKQCAS